MCEFLLNPFHRALLNCDAGLLSLFRSDDIVEFHRAIDGFKPTPLLSLPALASHLGVGQILVKDESHRLGLGAFKVLGASYAIYRFLRGLWAAMTDRPFSPASMYDGGLNELLGEMTFCTATDGNHGRAVAWMASRVGQKAIIYMPKDTVTARVRNIEREGATVVIVERTYDDAVHLAAEDAKANGWQIISDTGYTGYTEIPTHVVAGYATLFGEIDDALAEARETDPDLVFIQSGVGSLAAAACLHYARTDAAGKPMLVNVEPTGSACLLESARSPDGGTRSVRGGEDTIMAGLNCGTPSLVAWPVVKQGMDVFMSISDRYSEKAVRTFYNPKGSDTRIISGESGAAGLAGLLALCERNSLASARSHLDLNSGSRILLINTEGATDPENFDRIISTSG